MTDHEALYGELLADPTDDPPRLVFADWLEVHGETDFPNVPRLRSFTIRHIHANRLRADAGSGLDNLRNLNLEDLPLGGRQLNQLAHSSRLMYFHELRLVN